MDSHATCHCEIVWWQNIGNPFLRLYGLSISKDLQQLRIADLSLICGIAQKNNQSNGSGALALSWCKINKQKQDFSHLSSKILSPK